MYEEEQEDNILLLSKDPDHPLATYGILVDELYHQL